MENNNGFKCDQKSVLINFKPQITEHQIFGNHHLVTKLFVLPYKFNKDNPFIELYFHYDLGGKNYLSPISFGRPDPIEEFIRN